MTSYLLSVKGLPMKEWKRGKEATQRQNRRYYQLHREKELKRSRKFLEENRDIINLKRRERYARAKLARTRNPEGNSGT